MAKVRRHPLTSSKEIHIQNIKLINCDVGSNTNIGPRARGEEYSSHKDISKSSKHNLGNAK